jgi:arylsulfatase A-like enzyme
MSFSGAEMTTPRLLSLAAALLGLTATLFAQPAARPNIIFIMADDLGYGELGSYGQTLIQTPQLDQMAREGMRFTQFYAGSTVCAPARSVLMTGQHLGRPPFAATPATAACRRNR